MTRDEKFLKDARIEPCEIAEPTWMTWRDEEMQNLRNACATWIGQAQESDKRARNMKAWAILGWAFAGLLMLIPVIERVTR